MVKSSIVLAALLAAPFVAVAGPYKCTAADGKVSFQDQPCQAGATGSQITIKTTQPDPNATPPKRMTARDLPSTKASDEQKARNEQIDAHNRAVRCNSARRSLGVLKEQRPVFKYNNKGERVYIDDGTRQSEIASAERGVAENCN
jgi:hypothetical protein